MSVRLRNLTPQVQTVTIVRPDQTYSHAVYPLNYLNLTDEEYSFISPPLVEGVWEIDLNPSPVPPPPPPPVPGLYTTDDLPEGVANLYFTGTRAQAAAVGDIITNGVTNVAPSQNAVYDALALKADASAVVTAMSKSGDPALTGAVTLSEGANITLTQVGQDIQIASTGGGGGTLQDAYDAGTTIITNVGSGNVTISGTERLYVDATKGIFANTVGVGETAFKAWSDSGPGAEIHAGGGNVGLNVSSDSTALFLQVQTPSTDSILLGASTSGTLGLRVPAFITNYSLTLPAAQGTAGTVLTDVAGDGVLSWASVGGTLQDAFDAGNTITVATGQDGVNITLDDGAHTVGALQITNNNLTSAVPTVLINNNTFQSSIRILNNFPGGTPAVWVTATNTTAVLAEAAIGNALLGVNNGASATLHLQNQDVAGPVMELLGASAGTLSIFVPNSVSDYPLTLPATQSVGTQFLQNDGTGQLSWASAGSIGDSVTGGTNGSVLFVDAGNLAQDNGNLHWDNASKRLGIGTSVPSVELEMSGRMLISNSQSSPSLTVSSNNSTGVYLTSTGTNPNYYVLRATTTGGNNNGIEIAVQSGRKNLTFTAPANSGQVSLLVPDNVTTYPLTLPDAQSVGTQFLQNDGSGILSWATVAGGSPSIGGVVTGATAGSVLFAGSGTLEQDNANLFWDNSSKRLGIGTSTPGYALEVTGGDIRSSGDNKIVQESFGGTIALAQGGEVVATSNLYLDTSGVGSINLRPAFVTAMTILNGGNVGIGTVTPGYALEVVGEIVASQDISAGIGAVNAQINIGGTGNNVLTFGTNWRASANATNILKFRDVTNSREQFQMEPGATSAAAYARFYSNVTVDSTLGILEGGVSPTFYTYFQGGDQSADITYTLPASAGAAGEFLQTDAFGVLTWAAAGGGGWSTSVQTSAYLASNADEVFADSTGGSFTVTLPVTPTQGWRVRIADYAGTWATNNVTVGRNSENINGAAADFTLNVNDANVELVYVDATQGWRVLA